MGSGYNQENRITGGRISEGLLYSLTAELNTSRVGHTIDTIDCVPRIGNSSREPIEIIQKSVATSCCSTAPSFW